MKAVAGPLQSFRKVEQWPRHRYHTCARRHQASLECVDWILRRKAERLLDDSQECPRFVINVH